MANENGKVADKVAIIPIGKIRRNSVALRDVEKDSVDYQNLADSVKKRGVLIPILVREFPDEDHPGQILYGLIDGLQRYNAAMDAGLTEIAAKITEMDQAEIEETQIIANAQKIETKYIEYAQAIERLLERRPTLTILQLANELSKQPAWLYKILGMAKKLHDEIKPLVNDKKIVLSNAIELSKIPDKEEQLQWVDKAMTMDPAQFMENVAARIKQIKDARRSGKKEGPVEFQPVPNGRKWAEIKNEYLTGCTNVIAMIRREKITDPDEVAKATIAWCARMDKDSQAQQLAENEARKKKDAEEKDRKKLEREKQKEEEARKTRIELEQKVKEKTAATAGATA